MYGPVARLKSAFEPAPYDPLTSADWDDRFTKAILISAIVHTLFIFGLQFQQANPKLFENRNPPIDVVLVNAKSKDRPLKADVLAQHNLDGGGTAAIIFNGQLINRPELKQSTRPVSGLIVFH